MRLECPWTVVWKRDRLECPWTVVWKRDRLECPWTVVWKRDISFFNTAGRCLRRNGSFLVAINIINFVARFWFTLHGIGNGLINPRTPRSGDGHVGVQSSYLT